ncbi:ATP-binding protein [Roseofilum casamattae]|uniref:ATP-binding protein n=1 Tax=Roseofilum casamattae TaxID=3082944 RepID=UPI0024BD926C|nr:ATP-binding protein [Roseofilum casamattae]
MEIDSGGHHYLQDKIEILETKILFLEQKNRKLQQDKLCRELNEIKSLEIQRMASIYSWEVNILSRRMKCSDRLVKLLGRESIDNLFVDELFDIIHPDDVVHFQELYDNSVSRNVPFEMTHRLAFPNGEVRFVNHYCKTFFLDNGMPLKSMGFMQDITQLQHAEDRLKAAIAESEQLNQTLETKVKERTQQLELALGKLHTFQLQLVQREKMSALGNLVAGIAHEINNPLGFLEGNIQPARDYVKDLLGLLDLYRKKMPEPDLEIKAEIEEIDLEFVREDLPKLIQSMTGGVKRIRNISDSLRTFSRKDRDRKIAFNIHDGIDSTLLILQHRTKATKYRPPIKIIRKYGHLPEVQCFPGQLNQVFMNLLANAIDAVEESNIGKRFADIETAPNQITISTELSADRQTIFIRIADNGVGMTPEVQHKIFDQGFTTKEVGKGTGLGMAIARQIVTEKHNGTIACISTIGMGTCFELSLPLG